MLDIRRVAGQAVRLIQTISWGWLRIDPSPWITFVTRSATMSQGTIKRLTDKGFGFIANGSGTDLFFHMSAVEGVRFDELREGQKVSYNEGRGPKGPRAENIRVL
jgi:CspA family cold shock protein